MRIGPIVLNPTRVVLGIALVGSALFVAYAITVRDASAIPLLASGALVLGIVFTLLAIAGAFGAVSAARERREGLALAKAFLGGLAGMIAFACYAIAMVLGLLLRGGS